MCNNFRFSILKAALIALLMLPLSGCVGGILRGIYKDAGGCGPYCGTRALLIAPTGIHKDEDISGIQRFGLYAWCVANLPIEFVADTVLFPSDLKKWLGTPEKLRKNPFKREVH